MLLRRLRKSGNRGQAMTETVIIMPIMILLVFGTFQLMLLQHARILVEYAGYNACRAGIVNNGDEKAMINAALVSVLPLFGKTNNAGNLLLTWGRLQAMVAVGQAADGAMGALDEAVAGAVGIHFNNWLVSNALVDVNVVSPTEEDFILMGYEKDRNGDKIDYDEIDFDDVLDARHYKKNLLAAETRVMVPLKIPIINKIIWQLYMARMAYGDGADFTTKFEKQIALQTELNGEDIGDLNILQANIEMLKKLKIREAAEFNQLKLLAKAGAYFIPIRSTCGMQMQSNFYKKFSNKGAIDADFFRDLF